MEVVSGGALGCLPALLLEHHCESEWQAATRLDNAMLKVFRGPDLPSRLWRRNALVGYTSNRKIVLRP